MRYLPRARVYAVAVLFFAVGCDDKSTSKDDNHGTGSYTDGSVTPPLDGGADTDATSESPGSSDDEHVDLVPSDEKPPRTTPDRCHLVTFTRAGAETGQTELTGTGDGRRPHIVYGGDDIGAAMMTWAYFPSIIEEGDHWEVHVSPYSTSSMIEDAGITEQDAGVAYEFDYVEPFSPMSESASQETPRLAAGNGEYGLVWRDGRWDPNCTKETFNDCLHDIAFMRLDASGQPVGDTAEPIRISQQSQALPKPEITAIPNGYVVAWIDLSESTHRLLAARIDNSGTVSPIKELSTPETGIENEGDVSIAANNERLVAVWSTANREKILVRTWNHTDENPEAAPRVINEAKGDFHNTRIVAGGERFMLSWASLIGDDYEISVQPVDNRGHATDQISRTTWTTSDVRVSGLAWNGTNFAMAWESKRAPATAECAVEECSTQIYAALLGVTGELISTPVQISNDPNASTRPELAWDGIGWTILWEMMGNLRWRIFRGQMICD